MFSPVYLLRLMGAFKIKYFDKSNGQMKYKYVGV
jgi:hypothetical protein